MDRYLFACLILVGELANKIFGKSRESLWLNGFCVCPTMRSLAPWLCLLTVEQQEEISVSSGQYYIKNGYIYGPKKSGEYYVQNGYIYGPRNGGKYYIQNNYIYGPDCNGSFYIHNDYIYGPNEELPWLKD